MKRTVTAVMAVALLASGTARADALPDEVCDVELDTRMSVYMVTVAGQPYRNKRYLTFGDAVALRDVLKTDGACDKLAAPRSCELKLLAAGDYAIMRDGVNFDPYATLRTLKQATRYVRRLVKKKICTIAN